MMEGKAGDNKEQGLEKHYMYDISQAFCDIGKILEKAAFRKGKLVSEGSVQSHLAPCTWGRDSWKRRFFVLCWGGRGGSGGEKRRGREIHN